MLYIFKIFLPMPPLYLPTLPQMEGEMAPLFGSDFEAVISPRLTGLWGLLAQVHSQYSVVSSVSGKEIFTFTQILSLSTGWFCKSSLILSYLNSSNNDAQKVLKRYLKQIQQLILCSVSINDSAYNLLLCLDWDILSE